MPVKAAAGKKTMNDHESVRRLSLKYLSRAREEVGIGRRIKKKDIALVGPRVGLPCLPCAVLS